MKNQLVFFLLALPCLLFSQDYAMFETHHLTPKDGHDQALREEITEHNKLYHAEGPFTNHVFSVLNGPNTGDYVFAMGPCTFSQLDNRPSSVAHNDDWESVMHHAKTIVETQYWRLNEDLSYAPSVSDESPSAMQRVRYFDVANDDLFEKIQSQIVATIKASGVKRTRTMYRRAFLNNDDKDWAVVSPYGSWSELDEPGFDFEEAFKKVHGAESWDIFTADFDKAIISRRDEWRVREAGLVGYGN